MNYPFRSRQDRVLEADVFHAVIPLCKGSSSSRKCNCFIFGLIAAEPELARSGIRLRQFGGIIELLGGKKIHLEAMPSAS